MEVGDEYCVKEEIFVFYVNFSVFNYYIVFYECVLLCVVNRVGRKNGNVSGFVFNICCFW